jgi:hypothetical protein
MIVQTTIAGRLLLTLSPIGNRGRSEDRECFGNPSPALPTRIAGPSTALLLR